MGLGELMGKLVVDAAFAATRLVGLARDLGVFPGTVPFRSILTCSVACPVRTEISI